MSEEMKSAIRHLTKIGKDLSSPMAASYDYNVVEAFWSEWWEENKLFMASAEIGQKLSPEEKFIIMIPPPNVTGSLHLGHALTGSIEDTLTRWNRMCGKETLWLPGVDHAGIATQTVVEKQLFKQEQLTRHDLGREEFVNRIWKWKEAYGNRICHQLRRIGISADWTRERFTLDPMLNTAVTEAFVRMFDMQIIYRANRLVNWSCFLKTAISDIEVEYKELTEITRFKVPNHTKTYEFGALHSFAYQVADSDEKIVVATTRLETMLGDVAVAVHPEDPRYKHLIGKRLIHPFIPERHMTVVADPILVDMTFGTGAVKVTPAHDFNDFKCGERNGLERINIFTEDGKINEAGGRFCGMMRFDCREAIEKELNQLGLYIGKEKNPMSLGFCSRSGDVIEPFLKPQWWVKCDKLAERACQAVRNGELTILPDFFQDNWFQWLENIQDWCISRQLWWGHRIPAYRVTITDASGNSDQQERWAVGRNEEEALNNAEKFRNHESDTLTILQDEDVLDTWFSSGLFPMSTLGWPNTESPDFKAFFPGTLLETGHDILFFWVARMVMMSLCLTDQLPFKTVYLHAMVRDSDGAKMSKTLGNVIDPLEVIDGASLEVLIQKLRESNLTPASIEKGIEGKKKEFPDGIPPCGSDAMRIGLLSYTIQGRNINLDVKRLVGYRQFMNKLWNIVKFSLSNFPSDYTPDVNYLSAKPNEYINKWIINRLSKTIESVNSKLKKYEFGIAVQVLHNFWLHEIADVYLEAIKPIARGTDEIAKASTLNALFYVIENGLILFHPMIPFITEELFQRLPSYPSKSPSIAIAKFPVQMPHLEDDHAELVMEQIEAAVHTIRSMQANLNLFGKKPTIFLKCPEEIKNLLIDKIDIVTVLGKCGSLGFVDNVPEGCMMNVSGSIEVYLQMAGMINVEAEIKKLEKKEQILIKSVEGLQKKMNAPSYEEKTPQNIKDGFNQKLKSAEEEIEKIRSELAKFKGSP